MSVRIDASGDSLSRTTNLPTITGFTIMGWFYLVSDRGTATYQAVFSFGDSAGSEYYVVYWEGGTNSRWGAWNGSTEYTHGSLGPSTGTWYHISATVAGTGANQFLIYIHDITGAQVATLTGSGYVNVAAQKIWIGNDNDSEFSNERAAAIKVYDAVLTQAEIQQEMFSILPQRTANINSWYPCLPGATERLADYSGNGYNWTAGGTLTDEDPPPVGWGGHSILFPYAAGATNYTLTAAQGSFTLTGNASSLLAARLLTAANGSFTLTGRNAGLLFGHVLTAAQGTFTLTGNSATLLVARKLTAAQGTYTLTGQNAGLLAARILAAAQGSFTLTGYDVTLTYSGGGAVHYTLTAGSGSFVLTGQASPLLVSRVLSASQGSFTVTGRDANLLIARLLSAQGGAYTLTGRNAGLLRGLLLTASTGVFTVTGKDTNLLAQRVLAALQGTYTLTGYNVTLNYSGAIIFDFGDTSIIFEVRKGVDFEVDKGVQFENAKTVVFN